MGSTVEMVVLVCRKSASAVPGEEAAGSIPETVVRDFPKLVSGTRVLCLGWALLNLAGADHEEAAVDSSLETPVQTLPPKNAVHAVEVERTRNPEPLPPKKDFAEVEEHKSAVLAAPLVSDPVSDPNSSTADSPATPHQSDSPPAGLLAEGAHFLAAGSLWPDVRQRRRERLLQPVIVGRNGRLVRCSLGRTFWMVNG